MNTRWLLSVFVLLFVSQVSSRSVPARSVHSTSSLFTLAITRSHDRQQSNLHPAIIYQQHANRGLVRLARMTGTPIPTYDELLDNIAHRVESILAGSVSHLLDTSVLSGLVLKRKDGEHSVHITPQPHDIGYYGTVMLGTPPRSFKLLMDSGSADLWVASENCKAHDGGDCGSHARLGPKSSSSFTDTKQDWFIEYNTGKVSGTMVKDSVSLAGFTLQDHKFGVAKRETEDFTDPDIPFDGLLGLAKMQVAQQNTPTVIESLRQAGTIKHAITSYRIPRSVDGKDDGDITFGGMDPKHYDSKSLVKVKNTNNEGYWEVQLDDVTLNGKAMGWKGRKAVLDTGTTLFIAPREEVDALHGGILGARKVDDDWTLPCKPSGIDLALSIGGKDFSIDPRDLAFSPLDEQDERCYSGINYGPSGFWLIGDVFLKNVYMSTNEDTDEISLAKLTH